MLPLLSNIILKPVENKTRTGIDLPKKYNQNHPIAEVVGIGKESKLNGIIKIGDHVAFVRGAVILIVGEEMIVNEGAILAKINE